MKLLCVRTGKANLILPLINAQVNIKELRKLLVHCDLCFSSAAATALTFHEHTRMFRNYYVYEL